MVSRRVIFVGQAPARPAESGKPGSGRTSTARLARLLQMTRAEFSERFGWINLIGRWPGKNGKGDRWLPGIGRANAGDVVASLAAKRAPTTVFLLGHNVAEAFARDAEYFCGSIERPLGGPEVTFIVFPHPSGVSQWWNDLAHVDEARAVLQRWTKEA
jgi:uracil-DNA glycosylase